MRAACSTAGVPCSSGSRLPDYLKSRESVVPCARAGDRAVGGVTPPNLVESAFGASNPPSRASLARANALLSRERRLADGDGTRPAPARTLRDRAITVLSQARTAPSRAGTVFSRARKLPPRDRRPPYRASALVARERTRVAMATIVPARAWMPRVGAWMREDAGRGTGRRKTSPVLRETRPGRGGLVAGRELAARGTN